MRLWKWFLARFRLSASAVCEMSVGRGPHEDFHDYEDDESHPYPSHFIPYHCSRCGKEFYI
jgi:hypothetical protein